METEALDQFRNSVHQNLFDNIIPFWLANSIDNENGGFYGRITNDLQIDKTAPKGLILISRILWTFSALYRFRSKPEYLEIARRAYNYLVEKFLDNEYGGSHWTVDYRGLPVDSMKRIYGQAFVIYSFTEYYAASGEQEALNQAIRIFDLIEQHNYDPEFCGYFEASNRDWSMAEDMRLSEVDMNEKKSMNTHLHLLEAYTNLCRYWNGSCAKERLQEIIEDFINYIIDPETYHFKLFFDERWQPKSTGVSFGHDIEGSWLLCEAAEVLGKKQIIDEIKAVSLRIVDAIAREGISPQGALYLEKDVNGKLLADEFIWWPQAEAVIGFLNAYQLSGTEFYIEKALGVWNYIEKNIVDFKNGDWFYEVSAQGIANPKQLKVSEWKGPYHNGRACMEILKRLDIIQHLNS